MQIHWSHVDKVDPEEREAIEARIRELAEGHNDLIDVRIVGERTRHHRRTICLMPRRTMKIQPMTCLEVATTLAKHELRRAK